MHDEKMPVIPGERPVGSAWRYGVEPICKRTHGWDARLTVATILLLGLWAWARVRIGVGVRTVKRLKERNRPPPAIRFDLTVNLIRIVDSQAHDSF